MYFLGILIIILIISIIIKWQIDENNFNKNVEEMRKKYEIQRRIMFLQWLQEEERFRKEFDKINS